jgi:hypothetical protein
MLVNLPKERIPMSKPIPDYINSWRTTAQPQTYDVSEMVAKIFGGEGEGGDQR